VLRVYLHGRGLRFVWAWAARRTGEGKEGIDEMHMPSGARCMNNALGELR
jgi:hypothetical protein